MSSEYQNLEDSNINWLGVIPQHWTVSQLKHLARLSTGMTPPTSDSENYSDETEYGWVRPEDIDESGAPTSASKYLSAKGWSLARRIPAESSLICCIGTIGKVGFTKDTLTTNQQITAATFIGNARYFYFSILAAREELEVSATGNVMQILNSERLGEVKFALPPLKEQKQIAAFLDYETAKIDALIEKQQQLIALLGEKRQAVISHAVTKGLNPDAPMRDSGVEWLGEVPAHWKIWKFGHFAPIITCGIASTPTYVDESEGMPFLSAQNIRGNKLSLHKYNFIPHALHEQLTRYRRPEIGDILVTRVGAGIGDACVIDIDMEFSIYVSLTHIRVKPKIAVNRFIKYFFSSDYCNFLNYQGTVTGGGVGNLNVQNVEKYKIPLPSIEEQSDIADYIDGQGERFDELIRRAEIASELLQERRTALISAAVTGKIDVRNWKPPIDEKPHKPNKEAA